MIILLVYNAILTYVIVRIAIFYINKDNKNSTQLEVTPQILKKEKEESKLIPLTDLSPDQEVKLE
jgi:regulatory protein YycH of two-component signal transduction system YycFG